MTFSDDIKIPDQPYPELRGVLDAFVRGVAAALGGNLTGIYLVGSLATGDFDPDSDVDFLAVTNTELTEADRKPLQDIHTRIHDLDGYPAQHLEGSYISIGDLNNREAVGEKKLLYFDNGSTTPEDSVHDNQWHVRWILRERGITLAGPPPATLLDPIPLNALFEEIKGGLLKIRTLFEDELNRPRSFFNSRFGQSFTVLTCCRMLHTLHTGTVQSKKAGAAWAREFVDPVWSGLIDRAWKEREGVRFMVKIRQRADQTALNETLDFVNHAVAQMNSIEPGAG